MIQTGFFLKPGKKKLNGQMGMHFNFRVILIIIGLTIYVQKSLIKFLFSVKKIEIFFEMIFHFYILSAKSCISEY